MKTLNLNPQTKIPILGFGTWQLQGDKCQKAVEKALEVGYRHIDTAEVYENHQIIGKVLRKSKIPREKLFITSKVWRDDLGKRNVLKACQKALKELQTSYLDLYLIHWPNRNIPIAETLEALGNLKEKGLIKAIGVSNFTINHLKEALKVGVEITNNQVEFHPSLNQKKLKNFCEKRKIVITAYSPLAQGEDLKLPIIRKLALKYKKSPTQVILAWLIQKNIVAIPRSANPKHIEDNFKVLKGNLEERDIKLIDKIGGYLRTINPPFAEFDY